MTVPTLPGGFAIDRGGRAEIEESALAEAFAVARHACDRAREEILPRFRRVAVETKRDGSPVTEADRAAEKAIRATLASAFPDDAILGEEFGSTDGVSGRRWLIDPIDGTIAFSRGIPLFTTLVALLVGDEPVLGVIDLPAIDDRIGGVRGGGLFRGEERLRVSNRSTPSDALVCHGDVFCFDRAGLRTLYDRMSAEFRMLRGYTDAFGHSLVLSGAADAMVDCELNPWDAAATRVLCAEAGGVCWIRTREDGRKLDLVFGNPDTVERIGRLF